VSGEDNVCRRSKPKSTKVTLRCCGAPGRRDRSVPTGAPVGGGGTASALGLAGRRAEGEALDEAPREAAGALAREGGVAGGGAGAGSRGGGGAQLGEVLVGPADRWVLVLVAPPTEQQLGAAAEEAHWRTGGGGGGDTRGWIAVTTVDG